MDLQDAPKDPKHLDEVDACCGGDKEDHFHASSTLEPPAHDVRRKIGCCGILDEIFPVLRALNHPLILVGLVAHRWMGARGCTEYPIIDMILRNSQLHSITSNMVRTGHWRSFDAQELQKLPMYRGLGQFGEADIVLERTHHEMLQICYIKFWSEETYRINIDRCPLIEVPDVTPAFIQALWTQKVDYTESNPELACDASWLIRNLTRYLYLEVSPRWHAIVFQIDEPYDAMMEEYVSKYKRKPRIVAVSSQRVVQVQEWDPMTYPPKYLSQLPSRPVLAGADIVETKSKNDRNMLFFKESTRSAT